MNAAPLINSAHTANTTTKSLEMVLQHPDFLAIQGWQEQTYKEGELIIREGDQDNRIFLILDGEAQVEARVILDDDKVIRPGFFTLREYELFGELAIFDSQPRSASVTAIKESRIAVIDGDKLLQFFELHPEIGYRVLSEVIPMITARLRNSNKKTFSLFAWGLKAHGIEKHL